MSSNIVISAQNLRKVYQIYSSPMQRLGALRGVVGGLRVGSLSLWIPLISRLEKVKQSVLLVSMVPVNQLCCK